MRRLSTLLLVLLLSLNAFAGNTYIVTNAGLWQVFTTAAIAGVPKE